MSNPTPNTDPASIIPPEFVAGMAELGWSLGLDDLRKNVLRKTLAHVNEHNDTKIDATVRRVPSNGSIRFAVVLEAVKGEHRLVTEVEITSNELALPFHEYVVISAHQLSVSLLEFPDSVNYLAFERLPDGVRPQSRKRERELERELIRASNDYQWTLSAGSSEDRNDDYDDAIASASDRLENAALALAGYLSNGGINDRR